MRLKGWMNIFNFKMVNLPCIVHIITSKNKVLVIRLTAHQRVITWKSDFLSDFFVQSLWFEDVASYKWVLFIAC